MTKHIEHLAFNLKNTLPSMGSQLIEAHADMSHPANQSFAKHPNDPLEHAPSWHQFGIVEHSKRFHESMKGTVLDYIEKWGLSEPVEEVLSEEILILSSSRSFMRSTLRLVTVTLTPGMNLEKPLANATPRFPPPIMCIFFILLFILC